MLTTHVTSSNKPASGNDRTPPSTGEKTSSCLNYSPQPLSFGLSGREKDLEVMWCDRRFAGAWDSMVFVIFILISEFRSSACTEVGAGPSQVTLHIWSCTGWQRHRSSFTRLISTRFGSEPRQRERWQQQRTRETDVTAFYTRHTWRRPDMKREERGSKGSYRWCNSFENISNFNLTNEKEKKWCSQMNFWSMFSALFESFFSRKKKNVRINGILENKFLVSQASPWLILPAVKS